MMNKEWSVDNYNIRMCVEELMRMDNHNRPSSLMNSHCFW